MRGVDIFDKNGRLQSLVLYQCTSGYPVSYADCHLPEISNLKKTYGTVVKNIGFSGHHLGTAIDNAAYALGARWFERHLTLDRNWKGTDHAASLEPDDLKELAEGLISTAQAMTPKPSEILDVEKPQRQKLKWNN